MCGCRDPPNRNAEAIPGAVGGGDGGAAAAVELHASLTQRLSAHTLSGAEHGAESSERNFSHGGSSGSFGREDTNRCGEVTALLKRAKAMAFACIRRFHCFSRKQPRLRWVDAGLEQCYGCNRAGDTPPMDCKELTHDASHVCMMAERRVGVWGVAAAVQSDSRGQPPYPVRVGAADEWRRLADQFGGDGECGQERPLHVQRVHHAERHRHRAVREGRRGRVHGWCPQ